MVCNTNTGDIITESAVSLDILASASSALVNCLVTQAQAFQGDNYCNGDGSSESRNIPAIVVGVSLAVLALAGCYCYAKTTCKKSTTAEQKDLLLPHDTEGRLIEPTAVAVRR